MMMNKCIACDTLTEWFEPRFLYYACEVHRDIPPVLIHLYEVPRGVPSVFSRGVYISNVSPSLSNLDV